MNAIFTTPAFFTGAARSQDRGMDGEVGMGGRKVRKSSYSLLIAGTINK